jgi:hypothetical protein
MTKNLDEMDYDLDQFAKEHDAVRTVFSEIANLLDKIIKSESSDLSQGGPCAFGSASINEDKVRGTFTLEFMSRSYEFRFTSKIKTLSSGYGVTGNIKVIRKFAHDHEDDRGAEIANFDFNANGVVSRLDSISRQLTQKAHLEAFIVEFLFNDLVAEERAAAQK